VQGPAQGARASKPPRRSRARGWRESPWSVSSSRLHPPPPGAAGESRPRRPPRPASGDHAARRVGCRSLGRPPFSRRAWLRLNRPPCTWERGCCVPKFPAAGSSRAWSPGTARRLFSAWGGPEELTAEYGPLTLLAAPGRRAGRVRSRRPKERGRTWEPRPTPAIPLLNDRAPSKRRAQRARAVQMAHAGQGENPLALGEFRRAGGKTPNRSCPTQLEGNLQGDPAGNLPHRGSAEVEHKILEVFGHEAYARPWGGAEFRDVFLNAVPRRDGQAGWCSTVHRTTLLTPPAWTWRPGPPGKKRSSGLFPASFRPGRIR